jgi:short-subunit dehydrogenase
VDVVSESKDRTQRQPQVSRDEHAAHAADEAAGTSADHPGALIIGASSGMGAALARKLVAKGYRVALVARQRERLDALCADLNAAPVGRASQSDGRPIAAVYACDVTATEDAPALFARITRDVAPLRLVVYAAGTMPRVTTGQSFDDERAMVEVNVVGAMRWLGLAADYLEREGRGTLVGISSVAGDRGRPGNGAYMASKAALSTYLDSLRFRLRPRGVHVLTAKPGYVATEMTAGLKLPRPLTVSADRAAAGILRAAEQGRAVAYIPGYWGVIMWLVRALPRSVVARMPG